MNLAFIYLESFDRRAAGILTDDEMRVVEQQLLANPNAGAVVAGTNGARKVRVALPGRGKRGSARVIYLYIVVREKVYFLWAYAKSQQDDLTPGEKQEIAALVRRLQAER